MTPSTSSLKRKFAGPAATSPHLRKSLQLSNALKALARRRTTTNTNTIKDSDVSLRRAQHHNDNECDKTTKPYEVRVILPSGSSIALQFDNPGLTVHQFFEAVRQKLTSAPSCSTISADHEAANRELQIMWGPHVVVEDSDKNVVQDGEFFLPNSPSPRTLILKDGGPAISRSHHSQHHKKLGLQEEICNGAAQIHGDVKETVSCPYYTFFSALAHLVDESLQEVLQLSSEKLRIISVELDQRDGKLIIFDTGAGMDEASICTWGASISSPRSQAHGSGAKPLFHNEKLANFGGYGAISAGFHLGGSITVSSRPQLSSRVAVLHMGRSTWEEGAEANTVWKILGEARDASEEEVKSSPHGSFRKVEIADLKPETTQCNVAALRRKLKDFFFPYIQEDHGSASALRVRPVRIMAMGLDLAAVEGGLMAAVKTLSSNREPFVFHLQLTHDPGFGAGTSRAHATITCRYLPYTKGKEMIDVLQERLKQETPGAAGDDDGAGGVSRVTVRWRNRLLTDAQWKPLPFMERTDLRTAQQHCFKRVLAFIDTNDGFLPTPAKTSLVADHRFTKALMSFGLQQQNGTRVDVTVAGDGWPLTPQQLCKEYHKWVQESSQRYDGGEGEEDGLAPPRSAPLVCVTKPHNKLEMGITQPVFQVGWKMKINGAELNARDPERGPMRLKLVKSSAPQLFLTLECFVCVGPPESPGARYIVCRPIHVPEEQGSTVVEGPEPTFYLRDSTAFPLNDFIVKKFHEVDEITWTAYEDKLYGDKPASVELLNDLELQKFGLHGVIPSNSSVEAGFTLPKEILAVVRPRSCTRTNPGVIAGALAPGAPCRVDQRSIISEPMEVHLEVRFMDYVSEESCLSETQVATSKSVYNCTARACTRRGIQGLYSFLTNGTELDTLFATVGTYLLAFSLVSEKHRNVAPAVARVNVSASEEVERWQLCSHLGACYQHPAHWKLKGFTTRLGGFLDDALYLSGFDEYNNPVAFSGIPEELHLEIGMPDGESLELSATIASDRLRLVANNTALELKGIEIGGGSLAQFAPTYDAHLWVFIHNFPVASFQLTVFPGEPASVALTECDRLDNCLRPGQVIEKFVLQAFDDHKNAVEGGREIRIGVEGLQLLDQQDPMRQVGEHGCVHLGGLLRVTAGYNSKGTITILSDKGRSLLALDFHTVYRALRVLKEPGEACVGSQLEHLEVQVVDENGTVDTKMESFPHALTLDWEPGLSLPLRGGACTLPAIGLPHEPGTWRGRVAHALHPELFFVLEVEVVASSSEPHRVLAAPELPPVQVSTPPQQIWTVKKELGETSAVREDYGRLAAGTSVLRDEYGRQLKDFIDRNTKLQRKLREQGRKVKKAEEELGVLKRTRKEVDDMEALWKEELKAFESVAMATEGQQVAGANAPKPKTNTAAQVIEILKKQGDPPGSHAASILLEAVMNNSDVFSAGGAGCDILGIVALLASVDNDQLNRALVDYLGIEKMLMIVCRSEEGLKYLHALDANAWTSGDLTLHAFARRKNRSITGRFRVLILDEASFYKRPDGLPSIDTEHPQKLLIMPEPGGDGSCPKGFLGYAVNLLRFNPQQLQCYATPAKHSLRESLFFQLFSYLQVYDTKEHMVGAQEFLTTGAVSLDGGLIRAKSSLEHVLGEEPAVKFPVLQEKPRPPEENLAMVSSSSSFHQEKQYLMNMVQFELSQKIQALHDETGYVRLSLHIKKMETKLIRARSKISAMVKEVKREEERKAEILKRVAELRDGP